MGLVVVVIVVHRVAIAQFKWEENTNT